MQGEREVEEVGLDEGVARVEIAAGGHVVRWETPQGPRRLAVRVAAGGVTTVDGADATLPFLPPVPRGLAFVRVRPFGLDGAPLLGERVGIAGRAWDGRDRSLEGRTDREGACGFEVVPGTYRVEVGLGVRAVHARDGAQTDLDVRPAGEGEIAVEGRLPGALCVRRAGEFAWRCMDFGSGGWRRFSFLPPGRYEVGYQGGARVAGAVDVRAGEVARLAASPPPGGIDLEIALAPRWASPVTVRWAVGGSEGGLGAVREERTVVVPGDTALRVPVRSLPPGAYRVVVSAPGWKPFFQEVSVGDGTAEVYAALARE